MNKLWYNFRQRDALFLILRCSLIFEMNIWIFLRSYKDHHLKHNMYVFSVYKYLFYKNCRNLRKWNSSFSWYEFSHIIVEFIVEYWFATHIITCRLSSLFLRRYSWKLVTQNLICRYILTLLWRRCHILTKITLPWSPTVKKIIESGWSKGDD